MVHIVIEWALRHPFLRFCLVGGVATLIHAGVFFLTLYGGGTQVLGNCFGYAIASVWSYYINCLWTFASTLSWQGFLRFQMANSIVLVWGIIAGLLGQWLSFAPIATLTLTVIVGPILNYIGHSRITFRQSRS
ncbi:GtrA family protein [Pseudochelatococcus sp. G4_1912]|uniref:GtrA family protein n=1 Tax=Pseudochelatococcus sp. G4_1912 TaxID=3114288 RepID=UPI0039C719AB